MSAQSDMLQQLGRSVGTRAIVTDPALIEPWLVDWRGRWRGQARALLQPETTEEVAEIVGIASRYGVPLVPQGGNTSMVGGATPPPDGSAMLLSLRRMRRIRQMAEDHVVAEAGVILADLHAAAAEQGQRFPLTLGSRGSCTIGGLTATNAGGTQVLRFGTMRSLVLGVEAVLPDGSVYDGLAPLKKDNRGYDLDELLIGSEGTLGVITAVSLKLVPAVHARAVAWVGLNSPQAGLDLLRLLERSTDRIEGFEIMPAECLHAVLRHIHGTRAPLNSEHLWHALVEATATSADEEAPAELLQRLLAPALESGAIADAVVSTNEGQAEAFWKIRDSISEAERAEGPAAQHDVSVPVDAMPRFMVEAAEQVERAFPGTRASGYGHLGDGNIHFHVRAPAGSVRTWVDGEGKAASQLVHDLVTAADGSISAEHGIGQMKKDELARLASPARLTALRAIKSALDPRGIFNPGKLVD